MEKFIRLPFYLKFACILISIIALGYLMSIGQTIIVPFILGSLIALLLTPVGNFFEQKLKFPRTLASIVALLLFFGIIGGLFTLIGSQLTMLKNDWPAFEKQIMDGFHNAQDWVHQSFGIAYHEQLEYINTTAAKSVGQGTAMVGVALLSLSSMFILFVFTFLYSFFILIYRRHIVRFLLLLNKEKDHNIVWDIVHQVQYVVKKYIIGLFIQMFLVATLTFIALSIIGVKYSLLLSIITGVFNILPYVGIFLSVVIISLITVATSSLTNMVFVIGAMIIIHLIDSNFIVPKIVGSKVQVNSLFAMMAIIVGEMLWGISGMFLAIPILAVIKIIFDRVTELKAWGFLLGEEQSDNTTFLNLMGLLSGKTKKNE